MNISSDMLLLGHHCDRGDNFIIISRALAHYPGIHPLSPGVVKRFPGIVHRLHRPSRAAQSEFNSGMLSLPLNVGDFIGGWAVVSRPGFALPGSL